MGKECAKSELRVNTSPMTSDWDHLDHLMSPMTHQQTMLSPTFYKERTDYLQGKRHKKRQQIMTIKRYVIHLKYKCTRLL